ncbi:hypothetical protein [Pseudonocardia dioxanivorans]|uniref:hypothetical protein n=1 Tax=Pseudonocardia dioxanivorans TaxID=240495 RepID=UPI000CD2024C|nr:hypothetical protein [Pseudonocardia dioxanivorans]
MSRRIDFTKPVSDEDKAYLAERGRSVDQQKARQDWQDTVAKSVAGDEDLMIERSAYLARNKGRL